VSKERFTASRYHLMSAAEKRTQSLNVREPPTTCPSCGTQVMPADLIAHCEQRCQGPREPGPGSKWISWQEARSLVPKPTLVRWIKGGRVRFKGGRGDRQYLYRDLAQHLAQRTRNRRR
jgi:hypothetical protein